MASPQSEEGGLLVPLSKIKMKVVHVSSYQNDTPKSLEVVLILKAIINMVSHAG